MREMAAVVGRLMSMFVVLGAAGGVVLPHVAEICATILRFRWRMHLVASRLTYMFPRRCSVERVMEQVPRMARSRPLVRPVRVWGRFARSRVFSRSNALVPPVTARARSSKILAGSAVARAGLEKKRNCQSMCLLGSTMALAFDLQAKVKRDYAADQRAIFIFS